MSRSEIALLALTCLMTGIGYVLGRIDGYWKRAEEDRRTAALERMARLDDEIGDAP